jgi:hypothetical protein
MCPAAPKPSSTQQSWQEEAQQPQEAWQPGAQELTWGLKIRSHLLGSGEGEEAVVQSLGAHGLRAEGQGCGSLNTGGQHHLPTRQLQISAFRSG